DDTRELLESVQFAPARGRYKVYIIDEVHMLSTSSFNALLKTLEEPPEHVKFILATTDPQKIPVTILSRCLRFNLRRLLPDQIGGHLKKLLEAESIEAESAAIDRLARAADGSMRDGLSLLDQAIAFGGGKLEDDDVAQMLGSVDHAHVARLVEALGSGDAAALLEIVGELSAQARNLETVLTELAELLHRIGLVQLVPGYADPERSDWDSVQSLAGTLSPEDIQLYYQIAIQGGRDLGLAPDPRTGLEMTLLRMLAFKPVSAEVGAVGGGSEQGTAQPKATGSEARQSTQAAASASAAPKEAASTAASPPDMPPAPTTRQASIAQPEQAARSETAAQLAQAASLDWPRLMAELKLSGPVKELARNIQFETREGSDWRFLLSEDVRHLGNPGLVQQLQSALSSQLGQPVNLTVNTVQQAVASPAVATKQAELRQISDAEQAIEEDPTVRALKERFGARILEDSIQPLQ
ncbi:MAG: DNA polymerase III subunit gamma/tau, partial [Pseudomonadota bacterium]